MVSTTASSPMPSSTALCGTPTQYDLPVKDVACGVPNRNNNPDLMKMCCNGAPVVAYDNDCALYCLAYKQSADALTHCLFDGKLPYQDAWCNRKNTNETATQTSLPSETGSPSESSSPSSSASTTESGSPKPTGNSAPGGRFSTAFAVIFTVGIIVGVMV
ncbi:hypothetical protein MGYG_08233 [Nannizzia gypsea CBS 118893]|uniref:Uncharacterized protein n=1 Tax=Arthroderma gypseum (strain ATCC MYA-4604 / CBS 118893) TaxID=535722 RepID=E4V637_ARTGP|nr:hypothetical protein MGYG_08233 [Nannizzia gypsea CBS 118893]EFR05220.1 hypothetical protein MGYG_08233 [Nannizzia gypsea CBS 118893]